jgi:hypothetical protein
MVKSPPEIDPFTVSEAETRRIRAKMRATRPRKPRTDEIARSIPSLPKLACLGDWKTTVRQRSEHLEP